MIARHLVLLAVGCVAAALVSVSPVRAATVGFVDDVSNNGLANYVVAGSPATYNAGGFYELPDATNRGTVALTRSLASGGYYDAATDGKITFSAWVDATSASRTYLYWVNDPSSVVSTSTSSTGYGVHVRVRNTDDSPTWLAFVPNKTDFLGRIQNSTTGGANGARLVTSPANAVIDYDDSINPFTRLEWTIERIGSDNMFSFKMFRGNTSEFTDGTEITGAAWSYVDIASLFTAGYLGIGNNDQGSDVGFSEISLHRLQAMLEVIEAEITPAPEPGTVWGVAAVGCSLLVGRRRRLAANRLASQR